MQVPSEFDPDVVRSLRRSGDIFWLNLDSPSAATLVAMDEALGLDPDAWSAAGLDERGSPLRGPFLWHGGDSLVLSSVVPEDPVASIPEREVLVRMGENWVASSHPGIPAIRQLNLAGRPRYPGVVVGRILAAVADATAPMLLALDEQIEIAQRLALDAEESALPLLQDLRGRPCNFATCRSRTGR